jgi:hypothetical protein
LLNCSFGFLRAFAAIAARLETGSCPLPALGPAEVARLGVRFRFPHAPLPLSATPFAPRSLPGSTLLRRGLTSLCSCSAACAAPLFTSCEQAQGSPKFINLLLRTCRSPRLRWPRPDSRLRLPLFRLPRPTQRVGDHNFYPFGVNAHSSHRFGLFARTTPALTRRLPFTSGCVLHLCLLDSKVVIFAYHKLDSRLLAHRRKYKRPRSSIAISMSQRESYVEALPRAQKTVVESRCGAVNVGQA